MPLSVRTDGGISVGVNSANAQGFFNAADGENVGGYDAANAITPDGESKDMFSSTICPGWLDVGCEIGFFFIYSVFYTFTSWLASIAAGLTDAMIWISIQSWIYTNSEFIDRGWTILRDIVNISFIAGLLYAAYTLIVGNDNAGKKLVGWVVILALGINFSLFAARVIVDGGNILARSIYESIDSTGVRRDYSTQEGAKEITGALVQIMNPQKIILDNNNPYSPKPNDPGFLTAFLFIFFVAGIVNLALIFMFIKVGLLFVGRTIGLMLLMILAPVTVVSKMLPFVVNKSTKKYLTLEGWASEVFNLAVMAPVYMFFIYLIALFWQATTQGSALQVGGGDTIGWIANMVVMTIPILMTYQLLKIATEYAKELSGELGGTITAAVGAVGGMALGAAFAAAGSLGVSVIGGGLGQLLQSRGAGAAVSLQERQKKNEENKLRLNTLRDKFQSDPQNMSDEEKAEMRKLSRGQSLLSRGMRSVGDESLRGVASAAMGAGTNLRTRTFDVRNASIPGLGNAMTALQGAGLGQATIGNFQFGGLNSHYPPQPGGFDGMRERVAKKEAERIQQEANLIENAMLARGQAERRRMSDFENGQTARDINKASEDEEKEKREGKKGDKAKGRSDFENIRGKAGDIPLSPEEQRFVSEIAALDTAIGSITTSLQAKEARMKALTDKQKAFYDSNGKTADLTTQEKAELSRLAGETGTLKTDRDTKQTERATAEASRKALESQREKDAKKNAGKSRSAALENHSLSDLESLEAEYKQNGDGENAKLVAAVRSERLRQADKMKADRESGKLVKDEAKKAAEYQKTKEENEAKIAAVNADTTLSAAEKQQKVADLQKEIDSKKTKYSDNAELAQYGKDAKLLEQYKKEAAVYKKNFIEHEIKMMTDMGSQIGGAILKGLAAGVLAGGLGILPGISSAIVGQVTGMSVGGFAASTMIGGAAGLGAGLYTAGGTAANHMQSLYTDTSYANNLRNRLRTR